MRFRPVVIEENERWRMRADARLVPLDELEASDWIPFRKVLAGSKAQLMIGHVTLTSVDPGTRGVAFQTGRRRHRSQEVELSGRRHDR